jgi:hypothetical protein
MTDHIINLNLQIDWLVFFLNKVNVDVLQLSQKTIQNITFSSSTNFAVVQKSQYSLSNSSS